ncbi:PD-(D/E)XK nuclease family protein [Elusimicrobiota bacterium]
MAFELLSGKPASGKKTYLLNKINEFLRSGNDTQDLIVLTNSINTAKDINAAVTRELGSYSELCIESVTSYCKKILRENYFHSSIKPGFKIISDFEKRLLVKNILKRKIDLQFLKPSVSNEGMTKEISNFIDMAKRNPGWEKNISQEKGRDLKYKDLKLILDLYIQAQERFNYVDFVDVTLHTRDLLRGHPGLIGFKALFVYEAEDMDAIMGDILNVILSRVKEATVSLSRESGIYGFRGARPDLIYDTLLKEHDFKEKEFSGSRNESREYFLDNDTRDEQAENVALHIAGKIKQGIKPGKIAIISRSVGESLWVFTDALKKRGINYVMTGGIGFFRQMEIVRLMSFLNCIYKKEEVDDINLQRTMELTDTISEERLDVLRTTAVISNRPLGMIFKEEEPEQSDRFWEKISGLRERSKAVNVDRFVYEIMLEYGFFKKGIEDIFTARLYSYFYSIVTDFSSHYRKFLKRPLGFSEFMENLYDLLSGFGKEMDIPYAASKEAVQIMTVQRSKGETFEVAYVVDMIEDNFPRPFYESPLISEQDHRHLGIEPVPGIKEQYEFEKKLYEVAKTRGEQETVYCWYNYENDGSPVEPSVFVSTEKKKSIKRELQDAVVTETDLMIRLIEDFNKDTREKIIGEAAPYLMEKVQMVNAIEDFDPDMLKDKVKAGIPEKFSYTLMESYKDCPERFFLRNILKIKESPSISRDRGIAVHKILQELHTKKVSSEAETDGLIKDLWKKMNFCSDFRERNLFPAVNNMINNYIKAVRNEDFDVTATEKKFYFELDGEKISGRFDRIDKLASGEERVVDYKTSRKVPAERGLMSAVKRGDNFQIPVYGLAKGCRYFTIYRLREEPEKMEVTIDLSGEKEKEVLIESEKLILDTINGIKEGIFNAVESSRCRNCYYSRICPW